MQANAAGALKAAQAELGKRVQEIQSNWGGQITAYLHAAGIDSPAAWCAAFCVYAYTRAGGCPWDHIWAPAYVPAIQEWAVKHNLWRPRGSGYIPQAGDLAIFGDAEHIEFVEWGAAAAVGTIGGNTYDDAKQDYPHAAHLQGLWRKEYGLGNVRIMGYVALSSLQPAAPLPVNPAPRGVSITYRGKVIAGGEIRRGQTLAPLRPVVEALGYRVTWDAKTRTAGIELAGK